MARVRHLGVGFQEEGAHISKRIDSKPNVFSRLWRLLITGSAVFLHNLSYHFLGNGMYRNTTSPPNDCS